MCQINKIKFMDRPTDKQIADVLAGIASVEEAKMVARWFATEAGSAYLASAFDRDAKTIGMGMKNFMCLIRFLQRKFGQGFRNKFAVTVCVVFYFVQQWS